MSRTKILMLLRQLAQKDPATAYALREEFDGVLERESELKHHIASLLAANVRLFVAAQAHDEKAGHDALDAMMIATRTTSEAINAMAAEDAVR